MYIVYHKARPSRTINEDTKKKKKKKVKRFDDLRIEVRNGADKADPGVLRRMASHDPCIISSPLEPPCSTS